MPNTTNMLILITGLPGTGKSTFALALAKSMQTQYISSDQIREQLGLRGHYDPDSKNQVYEAILTLAQEYLGNGETVIIDSTLYLKRLRIPFAKLAKQLGVALEIIEVQADEAVVKERIAQKKRRYSEADFDVYLKIKNIYEPVTGPHLVIESTAVPLSELVEKAISYLQLSQHE
jgi:predicted kinase